MTLWASLLVMSLVMTVLAGFLAVVLRDLLAAALALGAQGLFLSLAFYLLQAPDVAIAQAGIGAALTTAIFLLAIRKTRRKEEE
ncbi:MAG: hydrogenase subunit MbhD domain-containing protein [Candidatus Bipolaricaulaceae bacterium]